MFRRAICNRRLGLGMHQMLDPPPPQAGEQRGKGFGLVRMAARQNQQVLHAQAIFRIILP